VAGVADEFGEAEEEGEGGGGHAAQGDDQCEPATVSVRAFPGDSAEDGEDQQGCDRSDEEDDGAGGEELAGVWLHKDIE